MRPVIITTEYRGVFFGYAENTSGDTIILKEARNCIYWHEGIRGFMGLASTDSLERCRIGAKVAQIELRKITAVVEVEPQAEKAWRSIDE